MCIHSLQNDTRRLKMSSSVTTRIPEELLKQIDRFSADLHMDRATMLRNLIELGLTEENRKKVLLQYKKRSISLQKAASLLKLDMAEMIDLLQREGLYLDYCGEELKEDLKGLA